MSKKTNAIKALAKQKPKMKRRNPALRYPPNVPFVPIFQGDPFLNLGINILSTFLFPPPPRPRDVWTCDPCNVQVSILNPEAGVPRFCPRCRGPLRLIGAPRNAATVDPGPTCIEAEYEDVTHKCLSAPEKPE